MTGGRIASFGLLLIIPLALAIYLLNARNDVAQLTRGFIGQIRAAEKRAGAAGTADVRSNERLGRTFHAWVQRYHYPEASLDERLALFEQLWFALRRADTASVRQESADRWRNAQGRELPQRTVSASTVNRSGKPRRLTIQYVQVRGSWVIRDARMEATP